MRAFLLAGVTAITLSSAAHATIYSFDGLIQTDLIASSGYYDITATGATGGGDTFVGGLGGAGASAVGNVYLLAGTTLQIVVGGVGGNGSGSGGGGGGGSFVYVGLATPLVIGGGGAGVGYASTVGDAASVSTSGVNGAGPSGGAGGTAGSLGNKYAG